MAFPAGPTNGQQTTVNGVVYTYNSTLTAWTVGTNPGGNISGNVLNITSAATIGTTLAVTGNITGGNVTATHYGSGAGLSSITGANVTGTVANATYATSAGSATSATSATTAGTVTTAAQSNITSVGTLTSLGVTGLLTAPTHLVNRAGGAATGIQWYSGSYYAWADYMSPAAATGCGPSGAITAPSGSVVTSWAKRSYIENSAGYGWTFESGTSNQVTPTVVAEIRSSDGSAKFAGSLGIGTAPSGTAGEIRATNAITAFYSDRRLKTEVGRIENALDKIDQLAGVLYTQNKLAESFGYNNYDVQVGLYAQDVQLVQPEAVKPAPFDIADNGSSKSGENYLTVQYEKLVPLLVEAIKELRLEVKELKGL